LRAKKIANGWLDLALSTIPGARRMARHAGLRSALGFEETIWTRKVPDREVRRLVEKLNPSRLSALEISGGVWRDYGFRAYRSTGFPEFDICAETLTERFDLIIAEHVFEHLRWPYRAAANVLRMLSPGGHFLIVTPFLYKVHNDPIDCVRWTEQGLGFFLEDAGFVPARTITGSWGNRRCVSATFRIEYRLFNRFLHPLDAEPDYPIVVWALARAPEALTPPAPAGRTCP
jgi:SAM-dependent methyltransferase